MNIVRCICGRGSYMNDPLGMRQCLSCWRESDEVYLWSKRFHIENPEVSEMTPFMGAYVGV